MTLPHIAAAERARQLALGDLDRYIMQFLETGIFGDKRPWYTPEKMLPNQEAREIDVDTPYVIARRICRGVARQAKRPFITSEVIYHMREWNSASRKYEKVDTPTFSRAEVSIPRRQYLHPMVAPVFLAGENVGGRWLPRRDNATSAIMYRMHSTVIRVRFFDETLYQEFMEMWDRPEMRDVRRCLPKGTYGGNHDTVE